MPHRRQPEFNDRGPRGPLLMQDVQLLEMMQHFNRERIPERVVHAKGSAAYGTFTVTHDITKYTKAKFLSKIGKKTDVLLRFSTVAGEAGRRMPSGMCAGSLSNFIPKKATGTWSAIIRRCSLSAIR